MADVVEPPREETDNVVKLTPTPADAPGRPLRKPRNRKQTAQPVACRRDRGGRTGRRRARRRLNHCPCRAASGRAPRWTKPRSDTAAAEPTDADPAAAERQAGRTVATVEAPLPDVARRPRNPRPEPQPAPRPGIFDRSAAGAGRGLQRPPPMPRPARRPADAPERTSAAKCRPRPRGAAPDSTTGCWRCATAWRSDTGPNGLGRGICGLAPLRKTGM